MVEVAARKPTGSGEVAGRTGLSLRTIRHYGEVVVVRPAERSEGGSGCVRSLKSVGLELVRRMASGLLPGDLRLPSGGWALSGGDAGAASGHGLL